MNIYIKFHVTVILLLAFFITFTEASNPLRANAGKDMQLNITPSKKAVYLDGSQSTGTNITNYDWYEGSKFIGSGKSRWYSLKENGEHIITLKIKDNLGNMSEDNVTIFVTGGNDANVSSSFPQYTLTYTAGPYGYLMGTTQQTVKKESSGTAIKAVANSGYHFVQWSDGKIANPRIDSSVQGDITVAAIFAQDKVFDTVKPIITLLGNADVTLIIGGSYIDAGAIATDDKDGNISDKITIISDVNSTKVGNYTVRYDVSDSAGNHADTAIRHIKVVPTFKYIGPGNGGAMYGIAVDPFDYEHIITGGDEGAAFETTDNGKNWKIIGGKSGNQPGSGGTWEIKADPKNKGTFWLAGGGVFKSTDGAKTWKRLSVDTGTYGAIGIDPDDSNNVYVAQGYVARGIISYSHGNVYHTTDGGNRWVKMSRPGGKHDSYENRTYSSIAIDRKYIYISGRGGIWRHEKTSDEGNWTEIGTNIYGYTSKQGAEICIANNKLVATISPAKGQSAAGVYISSDNGENWEPKNGKGNQNLSALIQRTKDRNKNINQEYIYPFVLAHSKNNPARLYLGSHDALAKSDDMGETWEMLTPIGDYGAYSNYFYNLATNSHDYVSVVTGANGFKHGIWGSMDSMHRMTVDPNDADIVYFSDNQDVYRSIDAGHTWKSITFDYVNQFVDFDMFNSKNNNNEITAKNRYEWSTKSRGIQDIVAKSVAVAPDNSGIIYIAYMDLGLEISRDNGKTWEHPTLQSQDTKVDRKNFLPPRGHTWALATDKDNPKDIYVSRLSGYLYKSSDYGKSWRRIFNIDKFWKVGNISSIVIDTNTPKENRTIYITTLSKGVYKSVDGGVSWTNINNGLGNNPKANIIKIDPNDHNTLYVGTKTGLFKTTNAGDTWENILKNGASQEVIDISIAQTNPTVVYANIYKNGYHGVWGFSDLWKLKNNEMKKISIDYNKDKNIPRIPYIGGIAVNPYNSEYIYTCARQVEYYKDVQANALLRSKDGGTTWENIIGEIPYARCNKIKIDPTNPQRLFVYMTFGVLEYFDGDAPTN